jgi:hypothetical protein
LIAKTIDPCGGILQCPADPTRQRAEAPSADASKGLASASSSNSSGSSTPTGPPVVEKANGCMTTSSITFAGFPGGTKNSLKSTPPAPRSFSPKAPAFRLASQISLSVGFVISRVGNSCCFSAFVGKSNLQCVPTVSAVSTLVRIRGASSFS